MTYNTKAVIIEIILIIVSTIVMITLMVFFQSRGLENLARLSTCIVSTTMGLYILFGKYVYLCGVIITKPLRIGVGLFLLLLMPVSWFVILFLRK